MSKVDELIEELCPHGVQHVILSDVGYFYGGLSGKSKNDFVEEGNSKFIPYMNVFSNASVNFSELLKVNVGASEKQNEVKYGDILFRFIRKY